MLRRSFLASAAAAAATSTSWVVNAAEVKPTENDTETDVLVIGFGGAGACAAMAAHDNNARVLLVEKSPNGGGNTSVSAGCFMLCDNKDHAYDYLIKTYDFGHSSMNPELVRVLVDDLTNVKPFLESIDKSVELFKLWGASYPELPYADEIVQYSTRYNGKTGGPALFDLYRKGVNDRNIPVWFDSPAKRLIESDGKVVGAQIEKEGKLCNVKACKGVILTCGGIENDAFLMENCLQGQDILFCGSPYNTGDGFKMAEAMGAKLWHLIAGSGALGTKIPGHQPGIYLVCPPAAIWVDQFGKRFIDEPDLDFHIGLYAVNMLDPIQLGYKHIPTWMIFDDRARQRQVLTGPIRGWIGEREGYTWSKGCVEEIKSGVVKQGETIAELAEKIGIDPKTLEETVTFWNEEVAKGKDTLFNRPMKNEKGFVVSEALKKPPYFAVPLYPLLWNTQAGPMKNTNCQVVDAFGDPIPGLYGAGELGSMWGCVYQGACNLLEANIFGRRAGKIVATL